MLWDLFQSGWRQNILNVYSAPSGFTSGLRSKHFPPFEASIGSGSSRTTVRRSRCRSSLLLSSCVRYLEMCFLSVTRAAAIGIAFENRARSKAAAALRWVGGRNKAAISFEHELS
jgi:hypothetical protein